MERLSRDSPRSDLCLPGVWLGRSLDGTFPQVEKSLRHRIGSLLKQQERPAEKIRQRPQQRPQRQPIPIRVGTKEDRRLDAL